MVKVLDHGYLELVEWMGGDAAVVRNARRCYRSTSRGEESDRKLIRHLISQDHRTPFEAAVMTFDVKCPLFVARQWFRHRIASYNEESLRYCVAEREFYVPREVEEDEESLLLWKSHHERAFDLYEHFFRDRGMRREQARALLPMGTYTKFYWTVNGSSLMNFLSLRTDRKAQPEIRLYAQAILEIVEEIMPLTFGTFREEKLRDREGAGALR